MTSDMGSYALTVTQFRCRVHHVYNKLLILALFAPVILESVIYVSGPQGGNVTLISNFTSNISARWFRWDGNDSHLICFYKRGEGLSTPYVGLSLSCAANQITIFNLTLNDSGRYGAEGFTRSGENETFLWYNLTVKPKPLETTPASNVTTIVTTPTVTSVKSSVTGNASLGPQLRAVAGFSHQTPLENNTHLALGEGFVPTMTSPGLSASEKYVGNHGVTEIANRTHTNSNYWVTLGTSASLLGSTETAVNLGNATTIIPQPVEHPAGEVQYQRTATHYSWMLIIVIILIIFIIICLQAPRKVYDRWKDSKQYGQVFVTDTEL
ncbi:membrane glycoprotein UL8 [Human betaherpesvirus 5]|uniref:Membrane glycoprotein UL8 n=1 Tax=Human cytomegalovirus TaxID=10359 RepID=A0A0G2UBK7_HCMV|nr:membrane glycoprotein UL8 [Human betaherpesvirus 5]AKI18767.1 membrane glycoprotein UL8 [Human betaherpesvirus 5]AKI22112.1 membrane glycoprotein UL8 [Human betaherpesvirus 5]AQN72661.1 membrane glycoprotein UL8 [Human betaherpesvirus 5]QTT58614.1 membrane glycoprotein UL8 [Human betaherpesvirus 5]